MSEDRKWMRRVGPDNLTANLDSVTEVGIDHAKGSSYSVITLEISNAGSRARAVFSEEQFKQWLAGAAFYVAGVELTSLPRPEVEEVDDGIPF